MQVSTIIPFYSSQQTLSVAIQLAKRVHDGQYLRDGVTPFVDHLAEIARRVSGQGGDYVTCAWLHKVLTHTPTSSMDLIKAGIPANVVNAVVLLTHSEHESYGTYLKRIALNPIARSIKIAEKLMKLEGAESDEEIRRYAAGLVILVDD